MRENFDYVTMDTYSADMADHTARAVAAIKSKKSDIKDLQRLIWLLVQANGGEMKIPYHVHQNYSPATAVIEMAYMAEDMSTVVRTR